MLSLRSRMLRLREPVRARPGDSGIELEPEAFALVVGEVVPPMLLATRGASWGDMRVLWRLDPDLAIPEDVRDRVLRSHTLERPVTPDEDGRFALELVPTGVELELRIANPFGPDASLALAPLAPGEKREVPVELELGITVSGQVLDERAGQRRHA